MKEKKNILVVFENIKEYNIPCEKYLEYNDWKDEKDVVCALRRQGYNVNLLGINQCIRPLVDTIKDKKPDLIFNLCESFNSKRSLEPNIASLCELLNIPYTGSNPLTLHICQDKALQKKILTYHNFNVPKFQVIPKENKNFTLESLKFPLIVKPLNLEASEGISLKSRVKNYKNCKIRINYLQKKFNSDVIIEEFIEGSEVYLGLMGKTNLTIFNPIEMVFSKIQNKKDYFATYKTKWDETYRKKIGVKIRPWNKNISNVRLIKNTCAKIYEILSLCGYARFDLRITSENKIYFLEANPNPAIAKNDEFALSAKNSGIFYDELILKILNDAWGNFKSNL